MSNTSDPIITVQNLSFAYIKKEEIFHDVSFEIFPKEIIAMTGNSGTGKTTMGLILKGIIPHSIHGKIKGDIIVSGLDIKKTKIAKLAKKIGMVFQDANSQMFSNTVKEEIEFGLRNLKLDLNWAEDAMKFLGIVELKDKLPMNLSAGQKQKVILASIIAMHPEILILDEPSAHLDFDSKKKLIKWLKKLNKEFGTTIVIIEQDPRIIGEICESILFFQDKSIERKEKKELLEKKEEWSWIFDSK